MSTKPAHLIATLAKGLDVLEALSDVEETGLTELARRRGVWGPTLFPARRCAIGWCPR